MEKLQQLLNKISKICQTSNIIQEATGARFNIFQILGVNRDENAHSQVLREFLSPDGSHGMKEQFLKLFISECLGNIEFNCERATVICEKSAGEHGRMDIIIEEAGGRKAIIIENKIDAPEQEKQIFRYGTYAESKGYNNYHILFLTLDGRKSHTAEEKKYIPISYSETIIAWLENCLCAAIRHPMVRETLAQFINHIKINTNKDMNDQKEMIEVLTEPGNMEAAISILTTGDAWYKAVINRYFIPALEALAKRKELKFEITKGFVNGNSNSGFCFYRETWNSQAIYFWTELANWKGYYWGISNHEKCNPMGKQEKKLCMFDLSASNEWPFGAQHLHSPYIDWGKEAFLDMVNDKFAKYIEGLLTYILQEIDDQKIEDLLLKG